MKEGCCHPSVLSLASTEGLTKIVQLLIEEGTDVNTVSILGATALKWASKEVHTEVVKLLKEAGAK